MPRPLPVLIRRSPGPMLACVIITSLVPVASGADQADAVRFNTDFEGGSLGTVESQPEPRIVTDAGRRLIERLRLLVAPDVAWERLRDEYIQLIGQRCALIDQGAKGTSFDANDAGWQDLFERVQRLRRDRFPEQPHRSM